MPALERMRVLDLTQYEAGTSCTQMLAWLGAQVVKVEQPGVGDPGRHTEQGLGDSLYFLSYNANKRSLTLDLRSKEGKEIFRELLPRFDVLVENFSLGTMERLGLGYDALRAIHPSLIYATIKGFGLSGPYAGFRCYDKVAQAMGGTFAITGSADGPPVPPDPTIGDTGSGLTLGLGIVAAYVQCLQTGVGQLVEVAMQEAVINFTRTALSRRERTGDPVPRRGPRHVAPTALYPCAPGGSNDYVFMQVVTTRMYDALVLAIGRPDLTIDPRFATQEARAKHGEELWEEIAAWTSRREKHRVLEELGAAGVPCGAVLDSSDLYHDPHLRERGAIAAMEHPTRGAWELPASPIRMSGSRVTLSPSPLLGQHTDDVLSEELSLDAQMLHGLHERGVI